MQEVWKTIESRGKYEVSTFGNIRRVGADVLRKQQKSDYMFIWLTNGARGTGKRIPVHRLVATAFIPNPENKKCVNHIDGDRYNNHASNLEWCTHSENMVHAYKNNLNHNKTGFDHFRSKTVLCLKTGIFYGSIREAAMYHPYYNEVQLAAKFRGDSHNNSNMITV